MREVHYMTNAHVQRTACGRYVNTAVQGLKAPMWSPAHDRVTCKSCRKAV